MASRSTRAPIRTCIGCRQRRPQAELVRVARTREGSLAIGRSLEGRGAWLCAGSTTCADQAAKRGAFARAFRASVPAEEVRRVLSAFVPDPSVRETGRPVTTGRDDEGAG